MVHDFFSKYLDLVGRKRIKLQKMKSCIMTAATAGFLYGKENVSQGIALSYTISYVSRKWTKSVRHIAFYVSSKIR
jgi:hypothetical protein